jgi:PfaD family protein
MIQTANGLHYTETPGMTCPPWQGSPQALHFDEQGIKACLRTLDQPCYLVRVAGQIGATNTPSASQGSAQGELLATLPPLAPEQFGAPDFRRAHGVRYAYYAGAMANAIASTDLVIALGQAGLLGSFGAAGVVPPRLAEAIQRIQHALPNGPYAFNLIHSPSEEAMERGAVELYLQHGIKTVEASAFLAVTPHVVRYRVAGLRLSPQNTIEITNRVIAKLSRREVAAQFLQPAPPNMLRELLAQGWITQQQAELAQHVPMADDITVEADSGGHTDNRPLMALLPSILALRDEIQAQQQYATPVRVGAGGGISTPQSALAAYMMGAAYIVTGSVNQACCEAGASAHTRELLAQADIADVMMAPAADMFELGVKVQLLKRGTLFPMRAQKLYDIYQTYDSIDAIPPEERAKLERQIFRKSLDTIWQETVDYFNTRDPEQIERAVGNPRRKMALIFRWYLGLSSRWSNSGEAGREMDYQIWCGPSMGAFNAWVRGSYLEDAANRRVVDVAHHIVHGTALLFRVQSLQLQGVYLPPHYAAYVPAPLA